MQVEAGQRAILFVQFEWRDFVDVPPIFGDGKIVLTLAIEILGRAIQNVLAERLGDADAFVRVLAAQAVEYNINSLGTNPCELRKKKEEIQIEGIRTRK